MEDDLTKAPQEAQEETEEKKVDEPTQAEEEAQKGADEPQITTEEIAEAERQEGLKESGGIEAAKEQARRAEEEEVEPELPSFFVEEGDESNRYRVDLDVLCNPQGRVVSVTKAGLGLNFESFKPLIHTMEWFDFSIPSYDELATYRQRSREYVKEASRKLVDPVQLRNLLLAWHLKDWSLRDKSGKKVEITHTEEGRIDNKTMEKVFGIKPPTLVDVVMTAFETDVLLV